MGRTILRTVRLDIPTDCAMRALAAEYEGNASKLLRQLIQAEAERRGVWPTNEKKLAGAAGRGRGSTQRGTGVAHG